MQESCFIAHSTGNQCSSRLLSMRDANALLILPQQSGFLEAAAVVEAIVIGPLQ
jgi:gephyrin